MKLFHHLKKVEIIALTFLMFILVGSGYRVGKAFYLDNTEVEYLNGGVYAEGSVGNVEVINPLFVQQGTVTQDLAELIFSGLTKFDTQTGDIRGDLADFKVDDTGKKYTFVIKENAKWHDGQPVTANDVIFTYENVIKNPQFNGDILSYNDYSGIKVTKIDERQVEFLLEKPDAFFLVKTTVGLLPKHLLEKEPVNLLRSSPFNFNPIGSGPYRFISEVGFPDYQEYSVESFPEFYDGEAHIKSILIRTFPSIEELKRNISNLDGVRVVPTELMETVSKGKFKLEGYELPQYVAVFINTEAAKVKEAKVRLGLKLGTDKQALMNLVGGGEAIDTPLLEIDEKDWVNQYSVKKANGALFEAGWEVPNKEALKQEVQTETQEPSVEASPTAEVTYITGPNGGKDYSTKAEPITIAGKAPENTEKIFVGDYELQKFKVGDSSWSYVAATKFDSLKKGKNVYEIYAKPVDGEKKLIDAITIYFEEEEEVTADEKAQIEKENQEAQDLPTRQNDAKEALSLRVIIPQTPEFYAQLAAELQNQWKKIGVELQVETLDLQAFQEKLSKRDYDLLLFGQNLGYNLDAYPYWHSSQAKEGGLNLSQFKNFVVDSLLEKARLDTDEDRQDTLKQIQTIISEDVPAIFLYSPTYYTALSEEIQYPEFKYLATNSDRLGTLPRWYVNANRRFKTGVSPLTFFSWVVHQF